ncbi:MAG: leucyl aminopeptidase [Desulfuromonadaceae bacterium]|nr:leucyl aminopeptidase [Desulfuromonas sp.]MDY0185837.1 leucyl aminopeptidase [Desulfuromonadaceae bacterium]
MLPAIDFLYPESGQIVDVPEGVPLEMTPPVVLPLDEQSWRCDNPALSPMLEQLEYLRAANIYTPKPKQMLFLPGRAGTPALILAGLGEKPDAAAWRQAGACAGAELLQKKYPCAQFDMASISAANSIPCTTQQLEWLVEGYLRSLYRFDKYQSAPDKKLPPHITLVISGVDPQELDALKRRLERGLIITQGETLARDLVNEPSNVKTPEYLARTAWEQGNDVGVKTTIYGKKALEQLGFGAMLGVAQGSICEPRLIVMEYQGASAQLAPVALVGKAVTFDSGGISLKPSAGMEQMKMDMAGGAAVMATLVTAARLQLAVNLIAVIPAVENMPSDRAMRPGDIVRSLCGKTIEVVNTDAEGRLILADALTWAGRKNPRAVIDMATLTGACIVALGHHTAAVLGTDAALAQDLIAAGEQCGEPLWQLPLRAEYAKQIESHVADVKNSGGRPAGTITAAAFLQHFAPDCPWAHVDIAGTAWAEKSQPGQPEGGTGFGVRLLLEYLRQLECGA